MNGMTKLELIQEIAYMALKNQDMRKEIIDFLDLSELQVDEIEWFLSMKSLADAI